MKRFATDRSTDLTAYLRDVEASPLLTIEEEHEWALRVASGDAEARDQMVRSNLRLVVAIARAYTGKGLSLDDLVAEGNLGLVRAVEGYNAAAGTRFSTYAAYWIKQSIRAAVMKLGKFVRLPAHAHTLMNKWRRAELSLREQLDRAPTFDEICDALSLSRRKRRVAAEALAASRLAPCRDSDAHGDEAALLDRAEQNGQSAEEQLDRAEVLRRVFHRLDLLDHRQALVVRLRYGLDGETGPLSLRQVSERLGGITRERVRQIEAQALRILGSGKFEVRERLSA
jgi:RNA polymerase primary sigma factor